VWAAGTACLSPVTEERHLGAGRAAPAHAGFEEDSSYEYPISPFDQTCWGPTNDSVLPNYILTRRKNKFENKYVYDEGSMQSRNKDMIYMKSNSNETIPSLLLLPYRLIFIPYVI